MKIDEFAYSSALVSTAPGIKLSLGVVVIFICLVGQSTAASCLVLLSMSALSLIYSAIGPGEYLRLLLVPLGFLLIGTVTVMVASYPLGHPMLLGWRIGDQMYGIDEASLRLGTNLMLRAWAAVSCMYFLSMNTPVKDILYTLRRIHVPLVLVTLMELIYRYIFVLLDQARTMRTAQASRLGYGTFRRSIQSTGQLIGALFLRTFQRCDAIYAALESRGYEGEMRMLPRRYRTNPRLILVISVLIAASMALTLWERGLVG